MLTFWIIVAVLTLAALAFLLPTLMGKTYVQAVDIDQNTVNARIARERLAALEAEFEGGAMAEDDYQVARSEVENSLLDDVDAAPEETAEKKSGAAAHWAPVIIGLLVPAMAVAFYAQLGDVNAVDYIPPIAKAAAPTQGHGNMAAPGAEGVASIEQMAKTLADRLEKQPEDPKGWAMLGRTYDVMQRYADAAFAYQTALSLTPDDADIMVNLAEALAMSEGGKLQDQPRELLGQALSVEPEHGKALWLMGMSHFQANEYQQAVDRWMPVLAQLPPDAPAFNELSRLIREAADKGGFSAPAQAVASAPLVDQLPAIGGGPAAQAPAPVAPVAQAAAAAAVQAEAAATAGDPSIKVSVSLAPELADKVNPDDVLYVFARATAGPKMPLAAMRLKASDMPITVMLNEQMAMIPSMTLSTFHEVLVGARVSKTGQAIPATGDLYGHVSPVAVKADQSVAVVISQIK